GIEQKQNAVNTIRDGHTDNLSTSEILTANALSQPSAGQSEYDNAVNTTTAEMVKEVDRTASEIQSLVNGVKAARDPSKAKQLVELLEVMLTPAEQGISLAGVQTSRFVEGEVSALDVFKALTIPGSSIGDIRERLMALQGDDRINFARNLIDKIKANSDLLFTNDNQTAIIENLEKVFSDEYSDAEKYADNIFNLLDLVGIGALLKGAAAARKALKTASVTEE